MSKFNVGDKVRILDVSKIEFGARYWKTGDVVLVVAIDNCRRPRLARSNTDFEGLYLYARELKAIELVEETPKLTKKARIEALERRVEELEKRLAEQKGDDPVTSDKITSANDVKLGDKITVEKGFSNFLRANSSYEVVEISSEKSDDGEGMAVLDDDGDDFVLGPEDYSKLRKVAS